MWYLVGAVATFMVCIVVLIVWSEELVREISDVGSVTLLVLLVTFCWPLTWIICVPILIGLKIKKGVKR